MRWMVAPGGAEIITFATLASNLSWGHDTTQAATEDAVGRGSRRGWAYQNSVHLDFIRPGRPVENGYILITSDEFMGALAERIRGSRWPLQPELLLRVRAVLSAWCDPLLQ